MAILSDGELLTRFRGGDECALEALFERYECPVFHLLLGILRDHHQAEDALQETFIKALLDSDAVDSERFRGWLFTVAANACRTRARWRLRWIPWESGTDRRSVEPADEDPDRRKAWLALRALPARDRLLLALRAQGLSYREIAEAAAIKEQSVGRLLARAVDRWKRAF